MTRVTDEELEDWLTHPGHLYLTKTDMVLDLRDARARIAALERDLAASRKRSDDQLNYAIRLQQLIENLKYDTETPHTELYHHKIIIAAKADLAASRKEAAEARGLLIAARDDAYDNNNGALISQFDAHLATYVEQKS